MGILGKSIPTAVLLLCLSSHAMAQSYSWTYGRWRVDVERSFTGDEYRTLCRAATGGDGDPVVSLEITDGDAGPPTAYPSMVVEERAIRGHRTTMNNGQAVGFVFDGEWVLYGIAEASFDHDGFAFAQASPRWQDTLDVLQRMQRGRMMEIVAVYPYTAGVAVYTASLEGFTAAYGKLMDSCGHSIHLF